MGKAIGMVELNSIARGIETGDFMVKAAQVELLQSCSICPGKYIVIVGGETAAVTASLAVGKEKSGERLVDSLLIPGVHPQLLPAIGMTSKVDEIEAVGVMEFCSAASAIMAADTAVKTAAVTLIEVRVGNIIGGKGYVILTGDIGDVREAVAAAEKNAKRMVESAVIPRPSSAVVESLMRGGKNKRYPMVRKDDINDAQ